MNNLSTYDIIVVGGGHAGIEAAHAAAKMGSKTILITLDLDKIGLMPCNPAIGGIGKGHIVYEISALGGLMPKLCSKTYLQARMLNTKKGPAVQGLRLQIDKYSYKTQSKIELEKVKNLTLFSGKVASVLLDDNKKVCGIKTANKQNIYGKTVILTTGTFLNGKIHIGQKNYDGGRRDEQAVTDLSKFLLSIGLKMGRLKTGTPPRLATSSVDFSKMEKQDIMDLHYLFEFYPQKSISTHPCYITHTNEKTHTIIQENLEKSAMYSGNISGVGPRYCPSIEDKIARFAQKKSHHVFVEPEGDHPDGRQANEVYPNGISTSLPLEVQEQYIKSIAGFENAIITKPGYAVEYDYVLPEQLDETLAVKKITGLFLAGQINGTTGYEEAAGQGLIAGINAHLLCTQQEPFILDRTESYIGVMIDDLVTLGIDEPYRMFTSRAERRLLLRQDNVFLRLMPKAYQIGLIDQQLYSDFKKEKQAVEQTLIELRKKYNNAELISLLKTEKLTTNFLQEQANLTISDRAKLIICAEIQYAPYIERENKEVAKRKLFNNLAIPTTFSYKEIPGLSIELQQKLHKHQPTTIAKAALIPGITPAALSLLIFKVRQHTGNIKVT